jgi:hypothetical protein
MERKNLKRMPQKPKSEKTIGASTEVKPKILNNHQKKAKGRLAQNVHSAPDTCQPSHPKRRLFIYETLHFPTHENYHIVPQTN